MPLLILLLLSFITHWNWFNSLSILASGDWYYQYPETMKEFFTFPQLWTNTAFGSVNLGISFYPFQFVYSLLAHAGMSYGLSERLVFLWPIALVSVISSFYLLKKNVDNTVGCIIGAIVFGFNTYFFSIKTGHLTLMAAYACTPFVILFFQKTLETKKVFYALLTGICLFIISFYESRVLYVDVILLFLYYLYFQGVIEHKNTIKQIIRNGIFAFIPILLVGLLNAYWILGFSKLGALTTNSVFSRMLFGNEFLNITNAFTLFHPFWTGGRPTEFIVQPIPVFFWIIPVYAVLGLFLNRHNKNILFFGVITLLGLLLTKQVGQPFMGLYQWLYEHFPGFNAFREASKFFFLIALGYSVLIASFIDWLYKNWTSTTAKKYSTYGMTVLIALLFLWNAKPAVTGEMATLFIPRSVPTDYVVVKDYLLNQPEFFRTYWLPTSSRWSIYTNTHSSLSAVDLVNGQWSDYLRDEFTNDKNSEADLMRLLLQKPFVNQLFDASAIKYVIVPLKDTANDDDFFRFYGKEPNYYVAVLDRLPFLKRVAIGTKDIVVYENDSVKPHIYVTKQKDILSATNSASVVTYFPKSATEYTITLPVTADPVFLQFSEAYHPQWKVHVGSVQWWKILLSKNYFLSDTQHTKNDSGLNTYRIDTQKICAEYTCTKNTKGESQVTLTLFFEPQSYVYIGLLISVITAVVSISSILVLLYKQKYHD